MVQEGTHNLNVTLKGYPKKCWALFGQKAHKTQLITLSPPKRRFILNSNEPRTDLQPKCKPKRLPNNILRSIWDGSTHNTAKFSDWLASLRMSFFIGHNADIVPI